MKKIYFSLVAGLAISACTMYTSYDEELLPDDDVAELESSSSETESSSSEKDEKSSSSVSKPSSEESSSSIQKSSSSEKVESSSSVEQSSSSEKVESSSSVEQSSSSEKVESSSSVEQSSSSEKENSSDQGKTISGFAQKGPFVKNAEISIYELKGDSTLEKASRVYKGKVTGSNNGAFEVEKVSLSSDYALMTAEGFFALESSGVNSSVSITLNAIADLNKNESANINILTHLEHARVETLLKQEKISLAEAKKKASQEIFKAFHMDAEQFKAVEQLNILGDGEDDGALLAASVLLLGSKDGKDLSNRLNAVAKDFADDGLLNGEGIVAEIADWAESADLTSVQKTMEKWGGKSQSLKKFVRNFWNQEYGLGDCVKDSLNKAKHVTLAKSKYFSTTFARGTTKEESLSAVRFVCSDVDASGKGNEDSELLWRKASLYEKDYSLWTCNENGSSDHEGNVYDKGGLMISPYSLDTVVCDMAENGDSTYRKAFVREITFGKACTYYMDESDVVTKSAIGYPYDFVCVGGAWRLSAKGTNPGRLVDERDNQVYATITIGEQEWMAENLNYDYNEGTAKSYCYDDEESNCKVTGRLYLWPAAMDSAAVFSEVGKGCGFGKSCTAASVSSTTVVRGGCPEGWHLPSNSDWSTLWTAIGGTSTAGTKLKSASGWNSNANGEDAYGFSVLPAGYYYDGRFNGAGYNGYFWSSTESNSNIAYFKDFGYNFSYVHETSLGKFHGFSVRCLRDASN